ncbi:unnamed protein product [Miscanthus lutarioriparius]|uniref:Uncharacterized protein n=1 Tax=Miscanthus lutarioriparius TaxID=422564 RepID=A0A811ME83_9POAL|nr:unnamed protein product [Miscanthus lutarioriparius]
MACSRTIGRWKRVVVPSEARQTAQRRQQRLGADTEAELRWRGNAGAVDLREPGLRADGGVGMQRRWPGGRAARTGMTGTNGAARQERFTDTDDSEATLARCGSSADQGTRARSLVGMGQHRRGAAARLVVSGVGMPVRDARVQDAEVEQGEIVRYGEQGEQWPGFLKEPG